MVTGSPKLGADVSALIGGKHYRSQSFYRLGTEDTEGMQDAVALCPRDWRIVFLKAGNRSCNAIRGTART